MKRRRITGTRGLRWVFTLLAGLALAVASALVAVSAPAHAATTGITVNGTQGGRTFDGIGAISGGGGNSRLLRDYPAAEQQQILDYLFKPGYGADLQILKVEIGGDTNSTDGSESSIEHSRGAVNCSAGYEWSAHGAGQGTQPQHQAVRAGVGRAGLDRRRQLLVHRHDQLSGELAELRGSHGLTINYLGGWNERGYNISWYEQLRSTLNADGYPAVQIVGADTDWRSPTTWCPTARSPRRCRSSAPTTPASG